MSRHLWSALIAVAIVACSSSSDHGTSDSGTPGDGSGSGSSGTFANFVIDLVENQTSDTTTPVAFASFSTLPDPDGDANNTAVFGPLFP